ncbi:30S ribosomal protein S14 [Candidatus Gromoviella agglomerans]|uniref:30S ribosomal protein S14 n=1 Tax=Candidatus Gromoviella agglomerans TaxID=2806609 RepID=UPI001E34D395|nr:30S ribosomal protein S14 [Candidatus Gromoviella agglomerans]UFX98572.1 30S ribosomal protein S14 [Candidatus Gromoviella agglomerans]
MAKVSSIEKNNYRATLVKKYDKKRSALKSIIMDKSLPLSDRYAASMKMAKLPRYSSKICLVNRCAITGRSRGVYRKRFGGISRIMLRKLASFGLLNGVVKA